MTFLPIVQRELRQAARKRSTFCVRWWAALLAMVSCFFGAAVFTLSAGRTAGKPLFSFLTAYAFGLCLLGGVALTADSLTEEKRQGTLGLLFLTELSGYDVVLGKFVAASLNAFYGLLALLPVMAVPLLLGGITGAEFWRMSLGLVNALFFSLALGMCVSALMWDSVRAMGNTLGLLVLVCAGLPALEYFAGRFGVSRWWAGLTCLSPSYPIVHSGGGRAPYWQPLLASHATAWIFLAAAGWSLPRLWQDRERGGWLGLLNRRFRLWSRHNPAWRAKARKTWMARNPMFWLVYEEIGVMWGAWAIVLGWGVFMALSLLILPDGSAASAYAVMPFGFLLKVLFALQACRFFVAARRHGALELLLVTPLSDREIVQGQALALWRSFLWPLVLLVIFMCLPVLIRLVAALRQGSFEPALPAISSSFFGGLYLVRLLLDLFALCWFGMALALTMKRPHLAPGLTILYVLVLPSLGAFCWLDILADIFFIAWGISRVQQGLRGLLARQYLPSAYPAQPGLQPPILAGK